MKVFRERLTQLLQEKGLRAAELARRVGVSETTISKYLNKENKKYAFDIVLRIAQVLDVSPEWLGGMTDERRPFFEPPLLEIHQQLSPNGKNQLLDYACYLLKKEQTSE